MKNSKIIVAISIGIAVFVSALLIFFHLKANDEATVHKKRDTLHLVDTTQKERVIPSNRQRVIPLNKERVILINRQRAILLNKERMPTLINHVLGKRGIPILLYHHILKRSENTFIGDPAVINLEDFEAQMKYLYDQRYHTATMTELESYLRGGKLPNKTVMIAFDDGLKTNYIYAYPILKKYHFRAVAFLITGRISQKPVPFNPKKLQSLSWPEVNAMRDVFEYGSHTNALHDEVLGLPALIAEPDQVILKDLTTSKNILKTNYFAYPFGAFNSRTIRLLKMAGYQYAFTVERVDVRFGDNPYMLGRIGIYPSTTLKQFKRIVQNM